MSAALKPFAEASPRHFANPRSWRARGDQEAFAELLPGGMTAAAELEISAWPGYRPSPLVSLPGLADAAAVGGIHYKDESGRFGLGSFKALGGAYAVCRLLTEDLQQRHDIGGLDGAGLQSGRYAKLTAGLTVASATDGNHGRSVAWGARRFGCACVIYIHAEVSQGREQALLAQGAEVVRVSGNYDDSVRRCAQDAERNGWTVVSDTSWQGYRRILLTVMAGYSVLVTELIHELGRRPPSHVFVQGGVGGIAATVADLFARTWQRERPRFIVVEPELAPCLYASAQAGAVRSVVIARETLMAGLSCGEVSPLAWEVLAGAADDFMTIGEELVAPAMKLLIDPPFGDARLVAGESAVAGLAAALAAGLSPKLRQSLELDAKSKILVIGTEGATDAEIFSRLTGHQPDSGAQA